MNNNFRQGCEPASETSPRDRASSTWGSAEVFNCFFFFFTLVTGPRRSLSLKLSDTLRPPGAEGFKFGDLGLRVEGVQGFKFRDLGLRVESFDI